MNAERLAHRQSRRERRRVRLELRRALGRRPRPRGPVAVSLAAVGTAVAAGAVLAAIVGRNEEGLPARLDREVSLRAARRMNRAAGTLAASVLFDSAIEHFRGAFKNRFMYVPLAVSSLSLAASAHGLQDKSRTAHLFRDTTYAVAGLAGLAGTGFHIYNVGKRVGGFCWQNLFYAAPLGAPFALVLSGLMGFLGERVRDNAPGRLPKIFGFTAGRFLAATTSAGLFGTVAEAWLLHFRGAFHNPFMLLPVTVPPVAGALVGSLAVKPAEPRFFTRWWLRFTAVLGLAGSLFHIIGVGRNMGGWRNWTQNLQNGPPIPAPPAFTGLSLAGLAALSLLQDHPDD